MSKPYWYELPEERIAQRPCYPYDQAKLLQLDRESGELVDSKFSSIASFLTKGDLLVFNDTQVIPARLLGEKADTGAKIEALLLKELDTNVWKALVKPKKKLKTGSTIRFGETLAEITGFEEGPYAYISFQLNQCFDEFLSTQGIMPIPPYIRKGLADEKDKKDYQTRFAENRGSVAAPTASLHFTSDVMESLTDKGVEHACITLHVGSASFLPVWDREAGEMSLPGSESFLVAGSSAEKILRARQEGRRVVVVGTTVARALESWAIADFATDTLLSTELFIEPGFSFTVVDALVTNFHQPGTTHMLLVEAFLGRDLLDKSYQHALSGSYRFLSYGDGMLIV